MADFILALPYILAHEVIGWPRENGKPIADIAAGMAAVKALGKSRYWYTEDPDDHGGATAWGIILRTAQRYGIVSKVDLQAISPEKVAAIYRDGFWKFNGLVDQRVATKVMDMGVNMAHSIREIQGALNDLGAGLIADGSYGPITERTINAVAPDTMLDLLCNVSEDHYRARVAADPSQNKWLAGWLERAKEVPCA
jgi:lysozyme family protein